MDAVTAKIFFVSKNPNAIVAKSAPVLPANADIPCQVLRSSVGYVSAAITYVVTFAPKLPKNELAKNKNMITPDCAESKIMDVMKNKAAHIKKENICNRTRPTLSLSMTLAAA